VRPQDEANRRPYGHELPQIVTEGVLRHSLKSDVITFKLRVLRVLELTFLVALPKEGTSRGPVYVRFRLLPDEGDRPGTVIVGG
jgi:hypothetical protein